MPDLAVVAPWEADPASVPAPEASPWDADPVAPSPQARLTVYTRFDDPGYEQGQTAKPNPLTGQARGVEGVTIAVDPAVIPYGSTVRIPRLAQFSQAGDGIFYAHDTGGDVKKRKASGGTAPIIDIYVDGADKDQAQKRRDALASALGTDPLDYQVLSAGAAEQPWLNDPAADTGKGRVRSALSTVGQSIERGVADAISGFGTLDQSLGNAMRGGDDAQAQAEMAGLQQSLKRVNALPDGAQKEELRAFFNERHAYLESVGSQMKLATALPAAGEAVRQDAAQRLQPNPAYEGEFLADTVPQVVGSAIQSVAPFVASPGAGVAAMFSQTYQATFDENKAKGANDETAAKRALLNGIISGGLEGVGDQIVAGAFKRLARGKAAHGALHEIVKSTAAEGLTGASQEAAQELIDREKLNPAEILKQGALEALGGLFLSGAGAGAGKIVKRLEKKPATIATAPWEADPIAEPDGSASVPASPNVGDGSPGGSPSQAPPAAPSLFAEVPAETPTPAPTIEAAAPGTSGGRSVGEPTPATLDEPTRQRLANEFSFPKGRLDYLAPQEAAPLLASQPNTRDGIAALQLAMRQAEERWQAAQPAPAEEAAPAPVAAAPTLDPRSQHLLENARRAAETRRQREEFNQQQQEAARSTEPATQEGEVAPENIPFAVQPQTSVAPKEVSRLAGIVREQWREIGERQGPRVIVLEDAAEVPATLGGSQVREVSTGGVVEAYFVPTTSARTGQVTGRHMVILRAGAAQIAAARGMTLEQRVRQLALHELVHHYGTAEEGGLGVLFPRAADRRRYNAAIDGLLGKLQRDAAGGQKQALETLHTLTLSRAEGGYGYDLADPSQRARAAEEYVARWHETAKSPGAVKRFVAQVKELLRALFPRLKWSDADVWQLLEGARSRAAAAVPAAAPGPQLAAFAQQPAADPRTPAQVLADNTTPDGTINLNGDTIISQHPAMRAAVARQAPMAEANRLSAQLYPAAAALRDEAFRLALAQPVTEANRTVVLTAGGPGSGKSRATRKLPAGSLIYDTNLRDPAAARARIAEIRASGREPLVSYVHRDFEHAVRSNIGERADRERRLSDVRNIAGGHHDARRAVLALAGEGVPVHVLHNRHEAAAIDLTIEQLEALPQPSVDELMREAHTVANDSEQKGTASAEAVAVFRGAEDHRRDEGQPHRGEPRGSEEGEGQAATEALASAEEYRAEAGRVAREAAAGRGVAPAERVSMAAELRAEPPARMSAQPRPLTAAEAAKDPEKRRQFIQQVKDSAAVAEPVKQRVESLYQPISDQKAIDAAKARVNEIGMDAAEREILGRTAPPDKFSNVLGIELMGRLQAEAQYERAAAIAVKIAEGNTSQAQAIQAMAIFARLGPGGIQAYAARLVREAIEKGGFSEDAKALDERLKTMMAELEKLRAQAATGAVLNVQEILKSAGWDAQKLAEMQGKLRAALIMAATQPGYAQERITGLLIAAGMKRPAAEKAAKRTVAEILRRMQRERDRMLRAMLRLKQGLPEGVPLESAIQQQLRAAMIANPGSLWERYRRDAARQLGDTAARLADPGERVRTPALQDFTARLLNTLKSQLPPERQPQTERDGVALLAEAVNNAEKYREVWEAARSYVAEKYRGNPQMLDRLDLLIGHQLTRPFSETTIARAVDDGLKQLETGVRDLLLRSNLDKSVAKSQLVSLIADRTGLRGDEAASLGNQILFAYTKAEAKARETYARGLFRDPIERVSKGDLLRWIEMNNSGVLTDSGFHEQLARKYGLPAFTSDDAARIAELQRRFDQAPDGDAKLVAGARMMDSIHSLVPASAWVKINAVRNMTMLLNPKTIARNVIGNQAMMITDAAADTLNGWVIDPLVSLLTRQRARSSGAVAARLSGLAQPWRDFWAGVASGREEGRSGRLELISDGMAYVRDMGRITQTGVWDTKDFGKTFRHTFSSRVGRFFEDGMAVLLGAGDRAFHAAAFNASLHDQLATARANGLEVLAPAPEMIDTALLAANRAIFQDDNLASAVLVRAKQAGNFASVQTLLQAWRGEKLTAGDFGLGSAVIPFAQIPGSIVSRGVEFSPLGFIRAAYEGLAPRLGRQTPFDQRAFGEALSRALVGTAGWTLGAWLLQLGIVSALPDEDKDLEEMRKSQGMGGLRVNVSELWRRLLSGNFFTPARSMFDSAHDGDLTINYDWLQPGAFMIAAGAQFAQSRARFDAKTLQGKMNRTGSAFAAGLLGAAASTERMSVVRNLQMLAQDIGTATQNNQSLAVPLGKQGAEVLGSFVPTVVKDLNALFDNSARETRVDFGRHPIDATLNTVLARVPGFAERFPPRFDAFGQAVEKYNYAGNTLFNVFLNPTFSSAVRKDPMKQELERIFLQTGAAAATPTSARARTVTINGQQRELTNDELAQFKYLAGRAATLRLEQMLAAPAWAKLPDELKARFAADAFSDAASAGKILLFGDRPRQPDRGSINAAVVARRLQLDQPFPR